MCDIYLQSNKLRIGDIFLAFPPKNFSLSGKIKAVTNCFSSYNLWLQNLSHAIVVSRGKVIVRSRYLSLLALHDCAGPMGYFEWCETLVKVYFSHVIFKSWGIL